MIRGYIRASLGWCDHKWRPLQRILATSIHTYGGECVKCGERFRFADPTTDSREQS